MHFIPAHGARIPALGFGTWPMKGEECARAVAEALAVGYRHIDTAAVYENEASVGEGIRASGVPRDQIFIVTKVWPSDLAEGDCERSVERSLKLLGIDAADLVLVHWPNRAMSAAAMIRPLNEAKRRGLARHIGVSNFTTGLLAETWAATSEPIVANQCEYHPYLDQRKVIAACRERGTAFVSYSPLGRRSLLDEPVVHDLAQRLGKTPAQIVLRWHLQQEGVAAIPKSSRPAHIAQNFAVFDFALDRADMDSIFALADPGGRMNRNPNAPDWDE